jgi:hypothetical protein
MYDNTLPVHDRLITPAFNALRFAAPVAIGPVLRRRNIFQFDVRKYVIVVKFLPC